MEETSSYKRIGLNLDAKVAAKIQDDFGDWIIQTFTEKK